MSLVDYASSDEDEAVAEVREEEEREPKHNSELLPSDDVPEHSPLPPPPSQSQRSRGQSTQQLDSFRGLAETSILKLPDASQLLNTPTVSSHLVSGWDHSSRVAAAMVENASRKRETNGPASSNNPRSKIPRGTLTHSKSVPDTLGGHLLPPQLSGRSNIVTEDIGKLFVRKQADASSQ